MILINQAQQSNLNAIDFKSTAQLYSGMDCWQTEINHLSLQSVTLTAPDDLPIQTGSIYRLNIPIEGARGIGMSIQITHIDANRIEAKWNQIDMDSFAILKRTFELNSKKAIVREEIKKLAAKKLG